MWHSCKALAQTAMKPTKLGEPWAGAFALWLVVGKLCLGEVSCWRCGGGVLSFVPYLCFLT